MIRVAQQAEADFRRVLMSADAASLCASEQVGKPLDLYYAPANLFVAGFIRSPAMNFFEAKVERIAGGQARVTGAGFRSLDLPATSLTVGDALTVDFSRNSCRWRLAGISFHGRRSIAARQCPPNQYSLAPCHEIYFG